jgi:hypothetical protein
MMPGMSIAEPARSELDVVLPPVISPFDWSKNLTSAKPT